ncbi:hypothetical protein Nepgr_017299 [Nepenthes gracilis]|uniref:C2H2-type domain-containing protein n=1 Tax=Nepenthes gracilis TaxID=150966 RepID=A0AAD3SQ56_NEPGR|nr:hypothetical protein Nepgr_017299 [Nepenthes gracilis]
MASNAAKCREFGEFAENEEDESSSEEEAADGWDDWNEDENQEASENTEFKCLFCDSVYSSCDSLFEHCTSTHFFDFRSIKKTLALDFYASFKLVNYVRHMVAGNRCWSCHILCNSNQDLQNHLHWVDIRKDLKLLWENDKYLQPFMQEDPLLYSFDAVEDGEEDQCMTLVDKEELLRDLRETGIVSSDDEIVNDTYACLSCATKENGIKDLTVISSGCLNVLGLSKNVVVNGDVAKEVNCSSSKKQRDKTVRVSFANVLASGISKVNEHYFGSYSSYGIHREMLSDKVRMDAYRQAILENPSLLNGAVVMDVGCGTGILSLFAAQAGASSVIAVEASEKMARVATQVVKENGLSWSENYKGDDHYTGIVKVVHGMVEELDKSLLIQTHSIDILLSEWMGYCLLYESMLSSVLFARDKWLKPGGAILPDTATMFAAGFGRGGTSLPFWENVYGFDMSCVGKELVEDAAETPIVDIIDSGDIVTMTVVLQTFDLATMKVEDMDFTACIELEPNSTTPMESTVWCHGVVLWFETAFTSRFCKEKPTILSTSPYTSKTHWSQTIFTLKEPIALSSENNPNAAKSATVGTDSRAAAKIQLRISVVRAAQHRSIDISLETTAVGHDGMKHSLPVQMFNLC